MSRKYKFHNKEGVYFVSFASVYWMDVFVREHYFHQAGMSVTLVPTKAVECVNANKTQQA